jgi:hypothetical protein
VASGEKKQTVNVTRRRKASVFTWLRRDKMAGQVGGGDNKESGSRGLSPHLEKMRMEGIFGLR